MKKMSRRTALKVMGAGILGLAGMAAWNRDQIIAFLDRDAAAHEAGDDSVQVKRRLYPASGTELSLLGFGAMRLPTRHGEIDEELAQKMVDYAYRHGVNYYDTAYMYHGGESEAFLGRALSKYPRESYFLVDKMPTFLITDPAEVPQIFEEQLRRCRTTYFDNYLLHSLSSRADFERIYLDGGGLDYLRKQKEVGRIRYLGFSFHGDMPFFDYLMDNFPWDCVMIQLNYLDWNEPDEAPDGARQGGSLYRKAMEKHTPCFVMEPVKGGRLADISSSAESVLRARQPDWSPAAWALRRRELPRRRDAALRHEHACAGRRECADDGGLRAADARRTARTRHVARRRRGQRDRLHVLPLLRPVPVRRRHRRHVPRLQHVGGAPAPRRRRGSDGKRQRARGISSPLPQRGREKGARRHVHPL